MYVSSSVKFSPREYTTVRERGPSLARPSLTKIKPCELLFERNADCRQAYIGQSRILEAITRGGRRIGNFGSHPGPRAQCVTFLHWSFHLVVMLAPVWICPRAFWAAYRCGEVVMYRLLCKLPVVRRAARQVHGLRPPSRDAQPAMLRRLPPGNFQRHSRPVSRLFKILLPLCARGVLRKTHIFYREKWSLLL